MVILGCPFMNTTDLKIYVKKGTITMKINGTKSELNVFEAVKSHDDTNDYFNIGVAPDSKSKVSQVFGNDSLQTILTHNFEDQSILEDNMKKYQSLKEMVQTLELDEPNIGKRSPSFEQVTTTNLSFIPSTMKRLKMKPK